MHQVAIHGWKAVLVGWYVLMSVFYSTLHAAWWIRKGLVSLRDRASKARRERLERLSARV